MKWIFTFWHKGNTSSKWQNCS